MLKTTINPKLNIILSECQIQHLYTSQALIRHSTRLQRRLWRSFHNHFILTTSSSFNQNQSGVSSLTSTRGARNPWGHLCGLLSTYPAQSAPFTAWWCFVQCHQSPLHLTSLPAAAPHAGPLACKGQATQWASSCSGPVCFNGLLLHGAYLPFSESRVCHS